ncbi:MAG: hypothetical protein J5589_06675 [Firmicutes bacterium]|nr:hypothetical protein [Bacillota bacterium]
MIRFVIKRIIRRPWLSLIGLVMAGAFCFILCYLVRYREGLQTQLDEVRESYEILCVVTDSRGVRSEGLSLNQSYADFIKDKENGLGQYVKDVHLAMELKINSSLGTGTLIGVNDEKAAGRLDPAMGGNCDYVVEDFFGSDENICLVAEDSYEALSGQMLTVKVTVPSTGPKEETVDRTYLVVGQYRGQGGDIYVPYQVAARLSGSGGSARTDSLSFILADNTKAEEMMEKAMEVFTTVDPASYSPRPALTVQDRQYKASISELEQNIRRTDLLLPICAILSLAAGFLIGFLAVRGETRSYALMRTLGVNGAGVMAMALGEQVLLPALGVMAVGFALGRPAAALVYFACHLVGCAIATLRPALSAPTRLLYEQD